jgi:hypothetical protein
VTAAEVAAFDLIYQEKFRAEYGDLLSALAARRRGRAAASAVRG